LKRFTSELKKLTKHTISLYGELLKVMIPVMILVRLAVEFGAIEVVGKLIAPVMGWVGLPGEMGFVWVTAMIVNIYAGAAALLTILPEYPLTIAQATILGSMILIAHSLPIEQRIAQKAGAGFLFTLSLRIIAAMLYGIMLSVFYSKFAEFQQPAEVVFLSLAPPAQDWLSWAISSIKSLWSIFWIIFVLLFGLRLLDILKITPLLAKALSPFLRLMGIGEKATSMTVTGALLGISYGGALIIQEARSGNLAEKDIFLSLSFMCLCHGLIEDTLFVMAFGGHYSGLLIGRFVFSLLAIMVLSQVVNKMPHLAFQRYLSSKPGYGANQTNAGQA
jgi:hypothetical protein